MSKYEKEELNQKQIDSMYKLVDVVIELNKSNSRNVLQIRYFFILINAALISYFTLKENGILTETNFYVSILIITIIFALVEAIYQDWGVLHTYRLYQLDNEIRRRILEPKEIYLDNLIHCRKPKEKPMERIKNVIEIPSYVFVYYPIITIISFFVLCSKSEESVNSVLWFAYLSFLTSAIFILYCSYSIVKKSDGSDVHKKMVLEAEYLLERNPKKCLKKCIHVFELLPDTKYEKNLYKNRDVFEETAKNFLKLLKKLTEEE